MLSFPDGSAVKEFACVAGGAVLGCDPWMGKIPWRRKWQPTPIFLSHGQRSLVGYDPWGLKELDMA